MKRLLGALGLAAGVVAVAAGCGGGSSAQRTPTEDPGQVLKTVIRNELSGHRELSYKLLVREQRKVVPAKFYANCSPGPTMQERDVDVAILGVHDEVFSVPALGKIKTKAVSYRMTIRSGGGPPTKISDIGHLIAQEGHWRWTLSASSFDSFSKGFCP